MLVASWSGKTITIKKSNGQTVRIFQASAPVVGVQVSGDDPSYAEVGVSLANGHAEVWRANGQLIRRM